VAGELILIADVSVQGSVAVSTEQDSPALAAAGVTQCVVSRLASMNLAGSPPEGGNFLVRIPVQFIAP
jgi:hypothetical protein